MNHDKRAISGKPSPRPVARTDLSPARLHQRTGASHSFGGYTKVNHGNVTFSMRKTHH
jgi:hypothetical protein